MHAGWVSTGLLFNEMDLSQKSQGAGRRENSFCQVETSLIVGCECVLHWRQRLRNSQVEGPLLNSVFIRGISLTFSTSFHL